MINIDLILRGSEIKWTINSAQWRFFLGAISHFENEIEKKNMN